MCVWLVLETLLVEVAVMVPGVPKLMVRLEVRLPPPDRPLPAEMDVVPSTESFHPDQLPL